MKEKMVTISLAELCIVAAGTKSAEECAQRLEAYKAIKDGSAEKEATAKKEAYAKELKAREANAVVNRTICARFNAIDNAIEEAIETFNEFDACDEEQETFEYVSGSNTVRITEVEEGYIVSFNNNDAMVTDLNDQRQIAQLVRYFQHC